MTDVPPADAMTPQATLRELHDVIANRLSAIAIQSAGALSAIEDMPGVARAVLLSVRENSVTALNEMRAMLPLLFAHGDHGLASSGSGAVGQPHGEDDPGP